MHLRLDYQHELHQEYAYKENELIIGMYFRGRKSDAVPLKCHAIALWHFWCLVL
jgi:hypothetical protein